MAESLSLSLSLRRLSHTDVHPLTSVPVLYYKIKDFLDRVFLRDNVTFENKKGDCSF